MNGAKVTCTFIRVSHLRETQVNAQRTEHVCPFIFHVLFYCGTILTVYQFY